MNSTALQALPGIVRSGTPAKADEPGRMKAKIKRSVGFRRELPSDDSKKVYPKYTRRSFFWNFPTRFV